MSHHILIVEDDKALRELYGIYLRRAQFNATLVRQASDAVEVLSNNTIDLVMVDVNLGDDVTGIDLLRHIRESDDYNDVKIVILTSLPERFEPWVEEQTSAFLNKPITYRELVAVIREALDE